MVKTRLLSAALALCLLFACLPTEVLAAEIQAAPFVTVLVNGAEIRSVETEGETWLFLPSSADLTSLTLQFADTENVRLRGTKGSRNAVNPVNLNTIARKDDLGRYVVEVITPVCTKTIYIMQGSEIPAVYLTSDDAAKDRNWVDQSKSNKATGTMKMVMPDGTTIYDGGLSQIKARGNSTFYFSPKKAYQIKLDEKTDLLGNGEKNKTWVLLANYADATLMHDKLMKDLTARLDVPYAPSCTWVDLYYDGEYRGVYTIGEKNSVGSTSVDITDMEALYEEINEGYGDDMETAEAVNAYGQTYLYTKNLTEPENRTGGFLIEINRQEVDEASGFYTGKGMGINVKSPEWAGQQAMAYISEYYQDFEDAVYAVDADGNYTGYNTRTGKYYYEYIDLTSLVQLYLLQRFPVNNDGFRASMYFYKDADDIMYAGPIWDMDLSFGTGWSEYLVPERNFHVYLTEALRYIPSFREAVESYFENTFLPEVEMLTGENGVVTEYKALLADSAAMNYVLWPYVRMGSPKVEGHLWSGNPDYDVVTADLTDWITQRIAVAKKLYLSAEKLSASDRFPDVRGHEAESAINFVVERGLFTGTGDKFEPNTVMNRAMLVTVLHRLAGMPEGGTQNFPDVPADEWYTEAVAWASSNGIVEGDASGFHPLDRLTREQLVTILYRYAKTLGLDTSVRGDLSQFYDTGRISPWAEEAVSWAVGTGVLKGRDATSLAPLSSARRGVVAMSFEQIILLIEK